MKRYHKGSLTVEAAFVMPVVICVVLLLLEYSMILHDTAVFYAIVEENAAITADRISGKSTGIADFGTLSRQRLFFSGNRKVAADPAGEIRSRAESALLFSRAEGVTVTETLTGIQVKGHLKARRKSFLFGFVEKEITVTLSTFERENKTRVAVVLMDALGSITGLFGEEEASSE